MDGGDFLNSKGAGRKPNFNPNAAARKEVKERAEFFKQAQSELSNIQKTPPKHLDAIGKYAWEKIVEEAQKGTLLKQLDKTELELFCMNYSICRNAWESVKKEGETLFFYEYIEMEVDGKIELIKNLKGSKKNPAVATITDTSRVLKSLANDLGLNFVSRANMTAPSSSAPSNNRSKDPIQEIKELFG